VTLTGALAAACFGQGVGDTLYVGSESVLIRDGKRAYNKVLITAMQGEPLTVTAVEGDWLKVKYGPNAVEGYVRGEALSARQVTASATATGSAGNATEVAGSAAGRSLTPEEQAAAAKSGGGGGAGSTLNASRYAAAKGLNPDPFYKMVVDSHSSVTDQVFDKFVADGKLGPKRANPSATTSPSVQ